MVVDKPELSAPEYAVLRGRQHAVGLKYVRLPLVGVADLLPGLMNLHLVAAPYCHRVDVAEHNIQEVASGPAAFVTLTELGSLTA